VHQVRLRQLIERGTPQKGPEGSDAGIIPELVIRLPLLPQGGVRLEGTLELPAGAVETRSESLATAQRRARRPLRTKPKHARSCCHHPAESKAADHQSLDLLVHVDLLFAA